MPRADGRIEPGQKITSAISARAWNRAQDAADIVLRQRLLFEPGATQGLGAPYTWVYARLDNPNATVPRWTPLEIGGVEITPTSDDSDAATKQFESMPVLTVSLIYPGFSKGKWCVAVEPIPAGKIGRVAVDGAVQVRKVDVENLAGAVVLWENDEWAIVRPGEPIFVGDTVEGDWEYDTVRTIAVEGGFSPEVRNLLISVRLPGLAYVTFARIGDEYQVVQFRLQDIDGYDATAGSLKVLGIREGWMEWIATEECPTE